MTPENFVYWLQGFVELQPGGMAPSLAQWESIKEHLALVFNKETKIDVSKSKEIEDLVNTSAPSGTPGWPYTFPTFTPSVPGPYQEKYLRIMC